MKNISEDFKNLSKKIKQQHLKLSINDGELTVREVNLMPISIFNSIPLSRLRARKQVIAKELKYSFEGQLFKTIMQQVEITVKNASEIKGKKLDFQYGILINNEFEYLDMGEYYIKDVEDDKNKEELVVTGYDKMLNFMIPFKQSDLQLTYPCEMKRLVKRIGEVCGVDLYSMNFFNSDLVVEEDFFTIQELTYRDVLEKVAQTTLTTIFIKENKLYLCKIGESVQTLDTSFLSNLVVGEKFGPANVLVLGRGSVEDNIESVDQQSINANGRCEIRFDENEFVDSKREQVIDGMLQQINGLEYYAIEASNLGILWLDPCDVIIVKDREESEYKTIYLKASVTINTGIKGEMEADIPKETTTEYKVTTKEEKKILKTERLAKKNEGLIKDIVEENSETSQKITQVEQTVDEITQSVSAVEEKVENAQTTANTAKSTADNTKNNLATNYYTKTEANSQINQKADSITSSVSKTYSTKTETANAKSEAINSANSSTDNKLKDYTVTSKLGTWVEQNYEYIKYAWNQISQYLKMEGIDGKATLNIYDENNNMLMSLSQDGQTFHDTFGNKIGTIGIVRENNKDTLAFGMNVDWNSVSESKSMAWGYFDKNGKFLPIFHLVGTYGGEGSEYGGELAVEGALSTDSLKIIKGTLESGETSFNVIDSNSNVLISVTQNINDSSKVFDSSIQGRTYFPDGLVVSEGIGFHHGNPVIDIEGNTVFCRVSGSDIAFYANGQFVNYLYSSTSDKRLKSNFKEIPDNLLKIIDELKIQQFNVKNREKINFGIIAQDFIKYCNQNNINPEEYEILGKFKKQIDDDIEYYKIDYTQFLILKQLATDKKIKELQEKDKQKDEIISDLIKRIENIERRS